MQVLVDGDLELLIVINELHNLENVVLKFFDFDIVGSDVSPILVDQSLHVLLPSSQVVHNVTQIGINLVVVLQIFVHFVSFFLQSRDFHFSGGDVSPQLLDFEVEHEFELL